VVLQVGWVESPVWVERPLPRSIVPSATSAVCRVLRLAMHAWWPPSPIGSLYKAPLLHTALVLNPECSWASASIPPPKPYLSHEAAGLSSKLMCHLLPARGCQEVSIGCVVRGAVHKQQAAHQALDLCHVAGLELDGGEGGGGQGGGHQAQTGCQRVSEGVF